MDERPAYAVGDLGDVRWLRRRFAALGLAVVLLALFSSTALSGPRDWTGVWDTQWRDGGAAMHLQQDGNRVIGTYPGFEGLIQGQVDGNQLSGTAETAVS